MVAGFFAGAAGWKLAVLAFLTVVFAFLSGRLWGLLESGFFREPPRIVSDIRPGIALVMVGSVGQGVLRGTVEGCPVRFLVGERVVEARGGQEFSFSMLP